MRDGWYWYWNGKAGAPYVMVRLWTGATKRQQIYINGRTRVHHMQRDAMRASGRLFAVDAELALHGGMDNRW